MFCSSDKRGSHALLRPVRAQLSRLLKASRGAVALAMVGPALLFMGSSMTSPANRGHIAPKSSPAFSVAYGSLNNFDCVNDTGVEAHGFDIELDDIRSTDITYTYDYNHYGAPRITEDLSDPLHPKVLVRYASAKNPDGSWAAYTAVPSGPISPTDGHQFTDPSINFGGEHFGVGYYGNPSAVKYNWLIDDGTGNLVHGPPVNVATPTFTYYPPAPGVNANVVAAIVPPPPPAPPVLQFGEATWVKSIKTITHNANKVRLQDLVSDDEGIPPPWANGEPDEVEVEWKLLQTEFAAADGGPNGELEGAPEEMPDGDEVITRRYEFYKYLGPFDAESGEAMASEVAADGLHGVGIVTFNSYIDPDTGEWVEETVDLSTVIVVGEFFGAQMSGFDVAPNLGLVDNLQDGELSLPYTDRRVVVGGPWPFFASITSGSLPPGMSLDGLSGVLSGIPTQVGPFTFTVEASDLSGAFVSHTYTLTITSAANEGTYSITTSSLPVAGGSTSGGGTFNAGDDVTVVATPNPGYYFNHWSEGDVHFCFTPSYTFTATASRDLVASFLADSIAPTTSANRTGQLGQNGWYVGSVQVDLAATDADSGVEVTYYRLDGGAQTTYAGPIQISAEGSHSLVFWSRDKAQNVEAAQTVAVNIDGTAPGLTVSASPSVLRPPNGKMVSVTISGVVTDGASGASSNSGTYTTVDSYGQVQPSGTFTMGANGAYTFTIQLEAKLVKKATVARTYTITVQALDVAGNQGSNSVVVTVPTRK